ncbi:MAG: winged helix-turn-helix domain-containing protein [Acetobacteraceae bacterium]|nr:winged helix-turn-helix domain-containing protein [Acetobacteraceae bacterium]
MGARAVLGEAGRDSAAGGLDRSVDVLVSRPRRKIEADPELPQLIVTVPGLGYKFPARPQAAEVSSDRCEPRMAIAASVPDSPASAVLPFQNISDDPGQECFANGVMEEIITALARLASFRIIAGPGGKRADVREMGRKLEVQYVLEVALSHLERSIRLNPLDGRLSPQGLGSVVAYTVAGSYEDALIWSDNALRDRPNDYL